MTKASCSKCPSTYELIPPPDPDYSEPKENPRSNDHIKRIYECREGGHRNTIYWHKKEFLSASSPNSSESERPYMSTKYGRESQGEFDKF